MTLSMYQASVPVLCHGLSNLAGILTKAEASATARGFDPAILLAARLAPDMHALPRQIQIAGDTAKRCAASLAGLEPPAFADTETNFAELHARIAKTIDYLKSIDQAAIDGSESREVIMKIPGRELRFTGQQFLSGFVLPNFYFHLSMAYAILRHQGVPLGKMDYLGAV